MKSFMNAARNVIHTVADAIALPANTQHNPSDEHKRQATTVSLFSQRGLPPPQSNRQEDVTWSAAVTDMVRFTEEGQGFASRQSDPKESYRNEKYLLGTKSVPGDAIPMPLPGDSDLHSVPALQTNRHLLPKMQPRKPGINNFRPQNTLNTTEGSRLSNIHANQGTKRRKLSSSQPRHAEQRGTRQKRSPEHHLNKKRKLEQRYSPSTQDKSSPVTYERVTTPIYGETHGPTEGAEKRQSQGAYLGNQELQHVEAITDSSGYASKAQTGMVKHVPTVEIPVRNTATPLYSFSLPGEDNGSASDNDSSPKVLSHLLHSANNTKRGMMIPGPRTNDASQIERPSKRLKPRRGSNSFRSLRVHEDRSSDDEHDIWSEDQTLWRNGANQHVLDALSRTLSSDGQPNETLETSNEAPIGETKSPYFPEAKRGSPRTAADVNIEEQGGSSHIGESRSGRSTLLTAAVTGQHVRKTLPVASRSGLDYIDRVQSGETMDKVDSDIDELALPASKNERNSTTIVFSNSTRDEIPPPRSGANDLAESRYADAPRLTALKYDGDIGPSQFTSSSALNGSRTPGAAAPSPDHLVFPLESCSWRTGDNLILYIDKNQGLVGLRQNARTFTTFVFARVERIAYCFSEPCPHVVVRLRGTRDARASSIGITFEHTGHAHDFVNSLETLCQVSALKKSLEHMEKSIRRERDQTDHQSNADDHNHVMEREQERHLLRVRNKLLADSSESMVGGIRGLAGRRIPRVIDCLQDDNRGQANDAREPLGRPNQTSSRNEAYEPGHADDAEFAKALGMRIQPKRARRVNAPAYHDVSGDDIDVVPVTRKFSHVHGLGVPWEFPVVFPETGRNRASVNFDDLEKLDEGEWLNDNLIEFYIRWLFETHHVSPSQVHFFNTHFYTALTSNVPRGQSINYKAVERWTSRDDLFEKDYLVVPVNEHLHWYLILICNLPYVMGNSKEVNGGDHGKKHNDREVIGETPTTSPRNDYKHSPLVDTDVEHLSDKTSQMSLVVEDLEDRNFVVRNEAKDLVEPVHSVLKDPATLRDVVTSRPRDNEAFGPRTDTTQQRSARQRLKQRKSTPSTPRKIAPRQPSIVVLDSLGLPRSKAISALKEYLVCEAKYKRGASIDAKETFRGMNAKQGIPRQDNWYDCGLYILGYVAKFAENPAEFGKKLLAQEFHADTDWPNMDPIAMRTLIRDELFAIYERQKAKHDADRKAKKQAKRDARRAREGYNGMSSDPVGSEAHPTSPAAPLALPDRPNDAQGRNELHRNVTEARHREADGHAEPDSDPPVQMASSPAGRQVSSIVGWPGDTGVRLWEESPTVSAPPENQDSTLALTERRDDNEIMLLDQSPLPTRSPPYAEPAASGSTITEIDEAGEALDTHQYRQPKLVPGLLAAASQDDTAPDTSLTSHVSHVDRPFGQRRNPPLMGVGRAQADRKQDVIELD